jgi:hypothetical protein
MKKKKQKNNNYQGQHKQVIETTSTLMNVEFIPVEDIQELQAIRNGGNGWKEVSVEKLGLERCVSPIRGTVYRVRVFGSPLDEHYTKAMVMRLLGSKKGRVFANAEGVLRVVLDLPKQDVKALLSRIMLDTYKMAGYTA